MKKILGLDLGTTSIGWALVNEAEKEHESSSIIQTGVRVNPLTVDEQRNFEQGKSITTNADRTLKRSMHRNLQRYKLRRENLIDCLISNNIISETDDLCECGNSSTFETYKLRAKAVTEEVSLNALARILLMINKKRGYKSSRKAKSSDEGQLVDGMAIAKRLYDENITPGQLMLSLIQQGVKTTPDFYRSDLQAEFDRIWKFQQQFYPQILTDDFYNQLIGKSKTITSKIFLGRYQIYTAENKGSEKKLQSYTWRANAINTQLSESELAYVLSDINGFINNSSGYLGAISDRSKELFFLNQTVGQMLMKNLEQNPNDSLKNMVFYRQDYLDEFEAIWEKQAEYHHELTPELKKEIRDIIIFYQRSLKSQKGLISYCELENKKVEVIIDGKTKIKTTGCKVCPKSSPLFQEFKIWQILNNLQVSTKNCKNGRFLEQYEKEILFDELNIKDKLTKADALKLLYNNHKELDLNYSDIEGNRTLASMFKAFLGIASIKDDKEYKFDKMSAKDILSTLTNSFSAHNYYTDILKFDSELQGHQFDQQPIYQLWHLLYSYEGDNSKTGNESLIKKLAQITNIETSLVKSLADVVFQPDYGSLSTKAMRKILPFMKEGNEYSAACTLAGYRHSKRSETKEELAAKVYKDSLELLPRNSLRNPVVEKILNQMINVVNTIITTYGKPDEIRIELARELKKNAKERADMTDAISKTTSEHEKYKEILKNEFGIINVSRNDIIRYKLYLELKDNGYKTLYSNTYIPQEKLFSKEFDIEHIIPQAKLFDDSFSNKTLEARSINLEKSNDTAFDFVVKKYNSTTEYESRLKSLYDSKAISKTKYSKLLMKGSDIPSDFIDRELRDSQYIAKKAREILEDLVKFVVPTTGSITDRLRDDWQLIDVMQELNWDKYDKLGLTEIIEDKDGRKIRRIKDWTKRNDHRHHAMDALTIAFTKRSYIQYLNNLNARSDKSGSIYAIEIKYLYRDSHGKLRFLPPMPLDEFRAKAKWHLQNTLISNKAKNKVVTPNINKTKSKSGCKKTIQLTPRGQLHNETIYGSMKHYVTKEVKVGAALNTEVINKIANKSYREALLARLNQFNGDSKKAFSGKNSIDKNPIFLDCLHTMQVPAKVKTVDLETIYTIRKPITPDLKIDKVIDTHIRQILTDRLNEYGNDPKKAFSNLDENPIWLNKQQGIAIKRVTISGISNALALHDKKDIKGNLIFNSDGNKIPTDYVSTGNNHHVAIYQDENGELQEKVVSFFEATTRANMKLPIVDKEYNSDLGWKLLFTMKQNEYFVFPNETTEFNPKDIDLTNPVNYALISPNLFRVQKLATKDYMFRHHLETTVDDVKELKDITWKRITSFSILNKIVKVRINHIGQIVYVGEY